MPDRTSLEQSEENLEGSSKEVFLRFVRKMYSWCSGDPKIDRLRTSCWAIVITVGKINTKMGIVPWHSDSWVGFSGLKLSILRGFLQ